MQLAGLRYYSPELGRWLSRDPIGEEDGWNLYCLLENEPRDGIDPYGLFSCSSTLTNSVGVVPFRTARRQIYRYCKWTGRSELIGHAVLVRAYIDASLTAGLPNPVLREIIGTVPRGGVLPFNRARTRMASYLGAGFMMRFQPNPRLNSCCRCGTTAWKQLKDAGGPDYLYSPAGTAVDFPGNTFSGYFPRSIRRNFVLDFLCDGRTRFRATWGYSIRIRRFGRRGGTSTVSLWLSF